MKTPDITKTESGLQQNDGLKPSREPELSYDENGKRANDRSEKEDNALREAMIKARDNRRDQPQEDIGNDIGNDVAGDFGTDLNAGTDTKH